ncbi:hypothetical protein TWF506_002487 [Arthrobotrys conoides]|uniref:Uncharacterized protein n=1 Tax=Arthrobotrys conoides TaxID=74498 RepID=A0AAN8ND41_9PEZI
MNTYLPNDFSDDDCPQGPSHSQAQGLSFVNGAAPLNLTSNFYGVSEEVPDAPGRHAGESIRPTSNARPIMVGLTNNSRRSRGPTYKYHEYNAPFVIHTAPGSPFGEQKFEWEYDDRVLRYPGGYVYYYKPLPGFGLDDYGLLELMEVEVGPCIKPEPQYLGVGVFEQRGHRIQWTLKSFKLNFESLEWYYELQMFMNGREHIMCKAESELRDRSLWKLYS